MAALAWVSFAPVAAERKIEVRFGVLAAGGDGRDPFIETLRVPNVAGQRYGWIATIAPRSTPVEWREELRLPTAPREWEGALAISEDRTIAQSRGVVPAGASEFANFWVVTSGDPNGRYELIVKVSDGVVADFAFDVVVAD